MDRNGADIVAAAFAAGGPSAAQFQINLDDRRPLTGPTEIAWRRTER